MNLIVTIVQTRITSHNTLKNYLKIDSLLKKQPPKPRGLLILPELFSTGTVLDDAQFEQSGGSVIFEKDRKFLSGLARSTGCHVMGSSIVKKRKKLENLSLYFSPTGRLKGIYKKIHPFSIGGESDNFRPGNKILRHRVAGILMQNTLCYDLRFPELYAAGFRKGVHLFTVQANWPASRQNHWDSLLKSRAIETQSYVVGVNVTGQVNNLMYSGGSKLISPTGRVILEAGKKEGVYSASISKNSCTVWRKKFPVLQDKKSWSFYKNN